MQRRRWQQLEKGWDIGLDGIREYLVDLSCDRELVPLRRKGTAGSFVNMTNHVAERISSNFTTYFILQFTLLFVHAAPTTTPSVRITLSPSENVTNYYQ
ncbi:Translation initiation factor [Dirofilaria immitis]